MTKKLFIKTYGCQMNVYDSERMAGALSAHGYTATDLIEEADLVVLNTCHIREKAAEKVYSELGRVRQLRDRRRADGQDVTIAVAGCVAQAEGEAMLQRAPFIDVVVGPQAYHRLPEMLARRGNRGPGIVDTEFPIESKFDELPDALVPAGPSAFLTIQEGCDKFCTFCVVPYTRGAEASRPAGAILREARTLVQGGACEITLLGQNVNAYRGTAPDGTGWGLGRLVRELAEIPGLARIRYTTSHPRDVDDDLISAHRDVPQLMPFLHLPVQSGSDPILKAMNRKHTADDYLRIVERLRDARPDLALSSDFIVGFPGESDEDFRATLRLVERVGYAQAFSFKYSPRPGTPASLMKKQLRDPVKTERLAHLQELLEVQRRSFDSASIGVQMEVLIERDGRDPGSKVGRSPWLQIVHLEGPDLRVGDLVTVEIEQLHARSLGGRLLGPPAQRGRAA
ncbi:MAG TPA: tRNA (N6-isopentenyl adenosine(37)-C2)-methylthiotransferase MiaB [Geminicoccus sp.]|uniref:tRNA (N6-isopentenyl adenosine(37)-C2)-methylthiotransferase MiaB n=1 Tax=Geminicoccus sp. TaxID=2024832 RepID=UPI002E320671|nr:tRNA (N6-isopentenyl adenosine(37)-C2)-methylthiotransferase MiaB [Geminicoccus sp.]HEX2526264.1 tRNA (N6-isopentenyl adenosine(37)-C2)-methylthiotransferase MiaB [Geminicoccus sp.]